ncbi:uncharacterized protein [Rutidosis leptorrhynchoides]|uniref:uncharacterized protein n=1 Tax=Rutidosis leptorrhynchoides TaxID=125765 RepID=UPI003A994E5F
MVKRHHFLLGKWWWRFKTETESLWVKVIRSIHGLSGGLLLEGESHHRPTIGSWRNIVLTGDSIEDLHVPFKSSFVKTIGDGGTTSFWHEQWSGGGKLSSMFPRLFMLERYKDAIFKDRVQKLGSSLTFSWNWSREPSGHTKGELDHIIDLLQNLSFDSNGADNWSWSLGSNSSSLFKVDVLSSAIDAKLLGNVSSIHPTFHNNFVPKKIEIFMWRALKKRLQVRVELDKRGIDLDNSLPHIESVDHSIIFFKYALEIWERLFRWWGLGSFSSYSLIEIINEDSNISASTHGSKIWQATKWVCAYIIWKNRNNKTFKRKCFIGPVTLSEIQVMSFEWISKRSKLKNLDWLVWLTNPSHYLSIV